MAVLIIPGGYAPDRLRRYDACLALVKAVSEAGGVVGHICHGAWVAISAKILAGRRTTCFFAIKDDVINSGAEYSTDKVVVDGKLVSAQTPEGQSPTGLRIHIVPLSDHTNPSRQTCPSSWLRFSNSCS